MILLLPIYMLFDRIPGRRRRLGRVESARLSS